MQRLRVFISSPGDVLEERTLAQRVIDRLNGEFAGRVILDPIFWEHEPLLATATFQEQIVRPSDTDVVISILWSRLGTRLPSNFKRPDGSGYASGTEYEFEDAMNGFRKSGRPDLLVYRKTAEPLVSLTNKQAVMESLAQRDALDEFVKKWFFDEDDGSLTGAFHTFDSPGEFEQLLEVHLHKLTERHVPRSESPGTSTPAIWKSGSPFRGLRTFEFEHAKVFFGRTKAVADILQILRERASRGRAFVLVFGMSGGGKSSVLRAGVLPMLSQPGVIEGVALWRRAIFRASASTGDLFDGLASALLREAALPMLKKEADSAVELAQILRDSPKGSVALVKMALTRVAAEFSLKTKETSTIQAKLVLVIDQMEEIFTSDGVTHEMRERFLDVIDAFARSGWVWVLAAMRSDYYSRCSEHRVLTALKAGGGDYDLLPPSAAEMGQMIRVPARAAGLRFEEDPASTEQLDDALRDAACEHPEILPLLEFTLDGLYERRDEDGLLTFEAYRQLGGVEGCLARQAEQVFEGLPANVQAALPRVLDALVHFDQDNEESIGRKPVKWDSVITPEAKTLIEAFVEARLFITELADDGSAIVVVAHEALFRQWPRVRNWVNANRELLRIHARVANAARQWRNQSKSPDFLLPTGKPLEEGESLLTEGLELGTGETEFITASIDKARRIKQMKRAVVAVLAVLTVFAGTAAVIAIDQRQVALERAERVLAEQSKVLAESARHAIESGNITEAILLALKALPSDLANPKRPYVSEAESALYYAVSRPRELLRLRHDADILQAAFSPDGTRLVSASIDHTARIWALDSDQELARLSHDGDVNHAEFNFDASQIVTASSDNTARIWDSATGNEIRRLNHENDVELAKFNPDGTRVVTASKDKTTRLWDTASGKELARMVHDQSVTDVTFNSVGTRILTASRDNAARLWDAENGTLLKRFVHQKEVHSAIFSPDERRILTLSPNDAVYLWDTNSGDKPVRFHHGSVLHTSIAFSPDGGRLLTAGMDHTARVWDTLSGDQLATLSHNSYVQQATFSPDGKRILTASADNSARIWDGVTYAEVARLGHAGSVSLASFSPDGRLIVTGSDDATVRLWDAELARKQVRLPHGNSVNWAEFDADGRRIVTASDDGTACLWETESGKKLTCLQHPNAVRHVRFSPDAARLVTAEVGGTARLWDVDTGDELAQLTHRGPVLYAEFGGNGELVVTAGYDKTAAIWRPNSQRTPDRLMHGGKVNHATVSPNGKMIATASADRTACLWDAESGTNLACMVHPSEVWQIAFSPDSARLVTASGDNVARLWDTDTADQITQLTHRGTVNFVAFSPSGDLVATASSDKTAMIWRPSGDAGALRLTHDDIVYSAMFSADGKRVVTASLDKTVRLWDAETGEELDRWRHEVRVDYAVFDPHGRYVVSVAQDSARVWRVLDLEGQALIDYALNIVAE